MRTDGWWGKRVVVEAAAPGGGSWEGDVLYINDIGLELRTAGGVKVFVPWAQIACVAEERG